jgi:hypothetical protein
MFNPKGSHFLDEQLAVSGLEMSVIDPVTATFAGISAVSSIFGGIMGSSSASKQNAAARKQYREQKKFNKKVARKTNEFNEKRDAAEQANYHAMRDYSYDTSIKNWERGKQLQDFAHAQDLRRFAKSNEIAAAQFGLNQEAAEQAFESQIASVEDMFLQNQFQGESSLGALQDVYTEQGFNIREEHAKLLGIKSKQNLGTASIANQVNSLMTAGSLQKQATLVEGLLAEGKASLGQAGGTRIKRKQSTAAALQRGIVGIERELTGKRVQAGIELAQLSAETSLAETGVGLNLEKINSAIKSAEGEAEYNGKIMSANMKSFIDQTGRNIDQLIQQKKYADINTKASMMLEPEFAGYDPKPEKPPEREFVESMKAIPGFTPAPAQQSTWAPIISGIGNAASALSRVDYGGKSLTPPPTLSTPSIPTPPITIPGGVGSIA